MADVSTILCLMKERPFKKIHTRFRLALALTLPLASGYGNDQPEEIIHVLPDYVVTGSNLTQDTELSPVPLTRLSEEELHIWGELSPDSVLRDQPFSYGYSNSANESNGGTGSAGANIRGLGNLSTLTLINGRRAGTNSAFGFEHGGFADLNLIPSAAIREIQIATDGTSVAYGSDAVAGTVNLLLYQDFVGNRVDASYSDTTDGDASEKALSFLTGQDLGEKVHLVLLGSWYQRNAIYARDREISKNTDRRNQGGQNQGSPTYPGRIRIDGTEYMLAEGVSVPTSMADYVPWDSSEDLYNYNEEALAVPSVERQSLMANLNYEITQHLELWTEFLYTRSIFDNGLAPAPWNAARGDDFNNSDLFQTIVDTSPHIPADVDPAEIQSLGYRSFELGNLSPKQEKNALRGLAGLRGEIGEWDWETAALYIGSDLDVAWSGIADKRILSDLIESGAFNPFAHPFATGIIPSGPNAGMTYDNAQALKQAEADPVNKYQEHLWNFDFKLSGSPLEIQAGAIRMAAGIEYRRETVDTKVDEIFNITSPFDTSNNNLGGLPKSSFGADREVFSEFAESLIPIFDSGSQTLDLSAALRYEAYRDRPEDNAVGSNCYNALVYKIGLNYQASPALRFLLSYGTSFRAPTLTESYGGYSLSNPIYHDPLGFTPASARIPTLIQSNPDLEPEKSETVNAGFVFAPEIDRGWRLETNYYHIRTKDAIVNGAQYFVNENAAAQPDGVTPGTLDPSAPFAGSVIRNADGTLAIILANWFNAAEIETDGIDYELSYRYHTTNGHWQASLGLNQVLSYEITAAPGGAAVSYLGDLVDPRAAGGNIVGRGSIPRYKGYARFIWNHGNLTLGSTLNYIHSLNDNPAFTTDEQPRKVAPWASLDLLASYAWPATANDWLNNTRLTIGIENATDNPPRFAAGAFADGYDSSLYSLEGRRVSISLRREF